MPSSVIMAAKKRLEIEADEKCTVILHRFSKQRRKDKSGSGMDIRF